METLKKLRQMSWSQVYRDNGLKWEKIFSVNPPGGVTAIYSLRFTQSRRATAYRDGDFMRLLTIAPDHDAAIWEEIGSHCVWLDYPSNGVVFTIEDAIHCEWINAEYHTLSEAMDELKMRASIAWDEAPNRAPCASWRACGREYAISEFDKATAPLREL